MTDAACPACGTMLDPARAPVARIRDGRVLTFCSTECAEGSARPTVGTGASDAIDGGGPPRRPRTQSSGAPVAVAGGQAWDDAPVVVAAGGHGTALESVRAAPRRRWSVAVFGIFFAAGASLIVLELASGPEQNGASAGEASVSALPSEGQPAAAAAEQTPPARRELTAAEAAEIASDPELVIDREKSLAAAMKLLEQRLESTWSRARNAAAMALSRVGDPRATKVLAEAIAQETSFTRRHQMAYALARDDDPRGLEALRKSLGSDRRDERTDAASRLAELGDDSGKKRLESLMNNARLKLSAAAWLALLGDERGLEELRAAAKDKRAPEARLRAVVALGRAGQAEVAEDLRAILAEDQYNVGAAAALSVLGDRSAIPALEAQLESPSLRVDAAVSLRRFDDVEPDLRALVNSLSTGDELASIKAAEALLILLSDEKPAEL